MKEYFANIKKSFRLRNFIPYFIVLGAIILLVLLAEVGAMKNSTIFLLEKMGYSIIAALSLSLVVGFLGELSLGHAAFMSLGAYIGGYFQTYVFAGLTASSPLLSIVLAMLIGGIIAAIFGFIIGLPALRLKGDYLAIVTLAFCQIVMTIFQNSKKFGAALGLKTFRYTKDSMFIISFIMVFLTLVSINNFIKSKHGRAVMAIRDNEIAAKAMGVNVTFYKLLVFVISAFFAGIAGVLFSNSTYQFQASTFDYNYSINILVMVVLGGMGNINGSIISAIVITYLDTKLATVLTGDFASLKNLIYAIILIIIVIYNNAPKLKYIREKYNLRNLIEKLRILLTKKHKRNDKINDPSREVEYGAAWSKIPTKIEMDAILSTDFTPDNTYVPDRPDKPTKEGK